MSEWSLQGHKGNPERVCCSYHLESNEFLHYRARWPGDGTRPDTGAIYLANPGGVPQYDLSREQEGEGEHFMGQAGLTDAQTD